MAIHPAQWGPSLWKVIHTLAEQSGCAEHEEESLAWWNMIRLLPRIMPCLRCSLHFQEWISTHNVHGILEKQGAEKREGLRRWFFDCHNRVNAQNNKAHLEVEKLSELYSQTNLNEVLKSLFEIFRQAQEKNIIQFTDVFRWKCAIATLRRLLHC